MFRYSSICLLLVSLIILSQSSFVITKADNIEAKSIVIYNYNLSSMPDGSYTNFFIKNNMNTTPTFTYGINNYNTGDALYIEQSYPSSLTVMSNSFTITIVFGTSTNVRMYSISYISIWNDKSFIAQSLLITPSINITTGSGDRFFAYYQTINFESIALVSIPFITGFRSNATTKYSLFIDVKIISNANYLINISTKGDCRITLAAINVLFYYTSNLTINNYYFVADTSGFGSLNNASAQKYSREITQYQTTEFILGISGFQGQTAISQYIKFGWSLSYNSSLSSIATVNFQYTNFQNLYYSYFQIGKKIIIQTNPPAESGSNYIPIIIGLLFGIAIVATAIVLLIKKSRSKQVYNMAKIDKDSLRALPSFNFT